MAVVTIMDFGQVEWQFFSRMSGPTHALPLVDGDAAVEGHRPDPVLGHLDLEVERLAGQRGGVDLEVLHPVLDPGAGDAEVVLLELLHAGQDHVAPQRVLDVEHLVEAVADDELRCPGLDALEQVLVAAEEPADQLLLRQLDGVGTRCEQAPVGDAGRGPLCSGTTSWFTSWNSVPSGRNSSIQRGISGTIWSFHADHSISAARSAPKRRVTSVVPPVDAQLRVVVA
jgi:hypothetical protein